MSKEGENGVILQMFKWTHKHFPNFLDCRPIFVQQAVKSAGFQNRECGKKKYVGAGRNCSGPQAATVACASIFLVLNRVRR
jgi:hypothetical protein